MRLGGIVLALGLAAVGPGTGIALAQGSRAVETCARTALQQAMLLMSVQAQSALRDRRGAVVGTRVDMRVNALGQKKVVSCFYTAATGSAVIRPYPEGGGASGGTPIDIAVLRRDAVRACQRSSQQQGLMLDTVASQNDLFDRRGQITGSQVIINVFQAGRPAQVVCAYDFQNRSTSLQLRRAALR